MTLGEDDDDDHHHHDHDHDDDDLQGLSFVLFLSCSERRVSTRAPGEMRVLIPIIFSLKLSSKSSYLHDH